MTHAFGRQPIGINQPPSGGSNYPFVSPSTDIRYLFGDFYLSYEDVECAYVTPFKVDWLYGFGSNSVSAPSGYPTPTHAKDLRITDAEGTVVFDSTTATSYETTAWADRLLIIQWEQAHQICRCTIHTEWSPEDTVVTYDSYITPDDGILDPRTYNRLPGRVRSMIVGLQTFTGDIDFEAGFNVLQKFTASARKDGTRFTNQIFMNAVPGEGLGRQPGCLETEAVVRRINRVRPDTAGNFTIELDNCFRSQLPLSVTEEAGVRTAEYAAEGLTHDEAMSALALHSDCHPCCECDYFVRTYRGLKRMWNRWKTIAEDAEIIRDTYDENRDRWLDSLNCRIEHALRAVAMSEPSCNSFLGAAYCNLSKCCISPLELRFTIQRFTNGVLDSSPITDMVVREAHLEGSTTAGDEIYTPSLAGQVVRFTADNADPQTTTTAKMRLCMTCTANQSLRVTVTAHTPDPAPAARSGDECDLPTAEVPTEISDLWDDAGIINTDTVRALVQKVIPLNPSAPSYVCNC